jgi:hypothetical protein
MSGEECVHPLSFFKMLLHMGPQFHMCAFILGQNSNLSSAVILGQS